MALYGSVITDRGRALIAKLIAGDTLSISRIMVGAGGPDDFATAQEIAGLTDLVEPIAAATSTVPSAHNGTVSFMIEFRSDMNGGLAEGFWLKEFGVFAFDPDEGEILFMYGFLGQYPIYMAPYTSVSTASTFIPDNVVRFPINISIGEGINVIVDYRCDAWMTAEEVKEYCTVILLPILLNECADLIAQHNVSPTAHEDIRALIAALSARVRLLELMLGVTDLANKFLVTFDTLNDVVVTGVWNKPAGRMEF